MTNSFIKKHKALSLLFVTGVLAIVGVLSVYKVSADPITWTQTDWSGGIDDTKIIDAYNNEEALTYKAGTDYIKVSESGQITIENALLTPNFDNASDLDNWDINTGTLEYEGANGYSANGSIYTIAADNSPIIMYQDLNVTPSLLANDDYRLSTYVYSPNPIVAQTVLLFFDGSAILTTKTQIGETDWWKLTSTDPISIPDANTHSYGVIFANIQGETVLLDDFELYQTNNILFSNIFDTGSPRLWGNLTYTSSGNGTIEIKVRTGNTITDNEISDANLISECDTIALDNDMTTSNAVYDGDRYIQYHINLQPNEFNEISSLEEISLTADDVATLTITPTTQDINEPERPDWFPETIFVNLELNAPLERDTTISFNTEGTATLGDDYTITASPLALTAGEITTDINITVPCDLMDEYDETIILNIDSPNNAYLETMQYTYNIIDFNPEPNVSWVTDSEMVSEDFGGPITITATLNAPSGKEITVPFNITGSAVGGGVDYTLDPETPSPLIISPGDTIASFDININNDDIYEDDESIIITIDAENLINAVTGGEFDITEETVTIVNDEAIPTIEFTFGNSNNNEDVSPVNIEVRLSGESSFNSQVDYIVTGGTATSGEDYILADSWITIPAGETTANISLTVVDNEMAEEPETIEITLSNPVPVTDLSLGVNIVHTYTINDDDVPGLNISAISGDTTEGGVSQTFTIELNTEPNGDVVVDFNSTDTSEGTVSPSTFIFDNTNWNTPQTITVTGVDDFLDDGDITYPINIGIDTEFLHVDPEHTTDTTGYAGLGLETVNITNLDDDTLAITVTPTSLTTHEYGSTADFTIVLGTQPDGAVIMNLVSTNINEGVISSSEITFDDTNWHLPQTLTITGVDDLDPDGDVPYTINIMMSGLSTDTTGYTMRDPADVSVINEDDDTPGIDVSVISGNTTEAGGTATFTVVLESLPTDDVTIALSSDNENEGTVSPSSLTFTNADWNSPQTVTVTGVDDDIDDGDIAYNIITAAAVSDDGNYNGLNGADVAVTNENDDTAGITVSAITGDTNEDGGMATFTIQLNSEPLDDVTIDISSDDDSEGSAGVASITITPETWSTPRGIIVNGLDDNIVDGDITYNIILAAATSTDPNYNGLNPADVEVINIDNDSIGFTVTQSAGATNVGEGSNTDSYTVRLNTLPSADVVITITPDAQVTVNPTTLTFTPGNWGNNQTVTVTAVNDTVVEGNHNGIISHSVASADLDYDGFALGNITAAITDNDTAPRSGGGGGGFWFPSSNPSETPVTPTPSTDPQREQRLERLRSMGVAVHGLVKIADDGNPNTTFDNIVYYVGADGKRHVFPNADIYKTWYDSFRYVRVYPMETLSQIPLGDNVRYKPGVKMIKFKSNNRVYAVEAGGKLRWIINEKVAWYMYGTGWQKQIVNIPDSLFPSYKFADDISHSNQFDFVDEANQSQNISMDLGL